MLQPFKLTEPELVTFQQLAEHHPFADFRLRALGILALAQGHTYALVAGILGVSTPTPYNWVKAWRTRGLMGLLNGHKGGAPAKLTPELLDTAEKIARSSPCTLSQIEQQLRGIHPDAPQFSFDCLSINLKKRGFSFTRTRLTLKKKVARNNSKLHRKT